MDLNIKRGKGKDPFDLVYDALNKIYRMLMRPRSAMTKTMASSTPTTTKLSVKKQIVLLIFDSECGKDMLYNNWAYAILRKVYHVPVCPSSAQRTLILDPSSAPWILSLLDFVSSNI